MLLGDINLAMTSTYDTDEAVQRFADLVVPQLADWCIVSVVDPDGTRRDVGRAHRDPAMVPHMHRYADLRVATNDATAPVPAMLREVRPVVIPRSSPTRSSARWSLVEEAREALAPLAPSAVAGFPLVARGEVIGGFTLVNGADRGPHTDAELRTAEIASRRAALALDNARLAAAQQQVAERLQLSLLSPAGAAGPLQLAVRYRPATRGIVIGGDWYDAFLQPDGDTVLVIGDVMGHDIEAAAAMGQVKTLVRGIALRPRWTSPPSVLRRVDHAMVGLAVPAMATALVGRIEQDADADGRPACAGCAGRPRDTRTRCCCCADGSVARPVGAGRAARWASAGWGRGPTSVCRDARGQHAAAVHRRPVRAARRCPWTRGATWSARSWSAGRPASRWTCCATGCSTRCWATASRTTSPCSPSGCTRWAPTRPAGGRRRGGPAGPADRLTRPPRPR